MSLRITPTLSLPEHELRESFIRASGPGGQNVNKVASAVQLQFDVPCSSLPAAVRARLLAAQASRLSAEGVLTITARRHRSQEQNRRDARERLLRMILDALEAPKPRHATRVPRAERRRRLEGKRHLAHKKRLRRPTNED